MNDVAVVRPVYNEAECICDVLDDWTKELDRVAITYRLIVLNDRSKDNTAEEICQAMEADFSRGAYEAGVRYGIRAVGELLARHFPPPSDNHNELPDRATII